MLRKCDLAKFRRVQILVTWCMLLILVIAASPPASKANVLFVAERLNGNIDAINTETGEAHVVASGLGAMIGSAVDQDGRLFVHRFDAQTVALVDTTNGTFVDIVSGVSGHGLFADKESGALYLAGWDDMVVYRIVEATPGNWQADVVADGAGFSRPIGVFLDGELLYVTNESDNTLYVKNLVTGTLDEVVELVGCHAGAIIDRELGGDLIIGSRCDEVFRVDAELGQLVAVYSGFSAPNGLVVDRSDNSVLICEHNGRQISRLDLQTGQRSVLSTFPDIPWQPSLLPISVPVVEIPTLGRPALIVFFLFLASLACIVLRRTVRDQ